MPENDPVALCQRLLRERFMAILGQNGRAALMGAPRGQNCGQHANWIGAVKLLRECSTELTVLPSSGAIQPDVVRQQIGNGVVFLSGALTADPGIAQHYAGIASLSNEIVVLPEQIRAGWKPSPELAGLVSRKPDVLILARDAAAQRQIEQAFAPSARAELAPPLTFFLGPQERKVQPQYDIVWVARTGRRDGSVEAAARLSSQSAERLELPDFRDGIAIDVVVRQRPPTVMLTDWSSLVFRNQEARIACETGPSLKTYFCLDDSSSKTTLTPLCR